MNCARNTFLVLVALTGLGAAGIGRVHDNGLARTPPMGWNSWNHFGCNVSAQLIREVADAMAANGMRDGAISTSPSTTAGRLRVTRKV